MIWAEHFLDTSSHLTININHCNYGSFPTPVHSHDQTPHNRLYSIAAHSPCNRSYICSHTDPDKKTELKAGNIYFIPGHYDLEYLFFPELIFTAIHFRLEPFTGFDIFSDEKEVRQLPDRDDIGEKVLELLQRSDSLGRTAQLKGLFLSLSGNFITHNSQTVLNMLTLKERYGHLFDWIRSNIRAGIRIDELADIAGFSTETLSRRFSRDTGTTLKQYLNRQLASEAAERLLASDKAIYEIAHALSFNDEYYFSRFFRRHTGLSPAEYRKRYRIDSLVEIL